jgi:Fe2+ transport system protein FeoA
MASSLHEPGVTRECVPLPDLQPGARAVVARVDGDGSLGQRLLDLGFVPETRVTVVRRAPLGDPIEYELRGYRVCLRRSEGARVLVKPL